MSAIASMAMVLPAHLRAQEGSTEAVQQPDHVAPLSDNVAAGPKQPNDCVYQAALYHKVNPWTLRAILKVESNFNPKAINKNRNGTVDVGIAQMNSMHFKELARFGVAPQHLFDACTASYVAAWHLRKQLNAHGNTWFAIGAYHSATPCFNRLYVALVWNALLQWRVVQGGRMPVAKMSDCGVGSQADSSQAQRRVASASVLSFDQ